MKVAGRDRRRWEVALVSCRPRHEPQLPGEILSSGEENGLTKGDSNCRDSVGRGGVAAGGVGLQRP
jgi:hypothetical protein